MTAGNRAPDGQGDHNPHTRTHTDLHNACNNFFFFSQRSYSKHQHMVCLLHTLLQRLPACFLTPTAPLAFTFSNQLYLEVRFNLVGYSQRDISNESHRYPHNHSHLLSNKLVRNSTPLAAGYLSPVEGTATKHCSNTTAAI